MRAGGSFPLETYYRVTWQLVIAFAAVLAVSSGVVRPAVTLPFFALAFVLMTPFAGAVLQQRRRRLAYAIGFAVLLLGGSEIVRLDRFEVLVEAMIEIITGFLPLLLLNHDRVRSYWLALLDATVIAVGSITFTSSALIYLGFLVFIVILLLNLNAANLHLPDASGRRLRDDLPRSYFSQFLRAAPAGALSAIAIFLAFPRVQSFTMSLGQLMGKSHTGYAGMITLSGDGEIETSKELAFLVDAKDKNWLQSNAPALLFRGDALDSFDGIRWTTGVFHYRSRDRSPDMRVATTYGAEVHDLTVHMEPTSLSTIFYPEVLLSILPRSAAAGQLLVNANGSIIRDQSTMERFDYVLKTTTPAPLSQLPPKALAALGAAAGIMAARTGNATEPPPYELSPKDRELYLGMPPAVRNAPWFKSWVREVAAQPGVDTLAAFSAHMDQYFASKYVATMKNEFSGEDTLESFLARDHQGHCEYFATATALLLRELGVPARVVVGFKGGTFNRLIDMLEVREENAHAWVEAYVDGQGWYALDPTPMAAGMGEDDLASTFHTYVNALSFWFRQYVVDYDQATQRDILRSIRQTYDRGRTGQPINWKELLTTYGRPVAGLALLGALVYALSRIRRNKRLEAELPAYYRVFAARASRLGFRRQDGETFARFHARMLAGATGAPGLAADLVAEIDHALEQDLYASTPLGEADRKSLLRRVAR